MYFNSQTINTSIGHENSEISIFWLHLTLLHDYLEIIKKWKVERNSSQGLYSRHSIDFPNINKLSVSTYLDLKQLLTRGII